MARGGAQRDTHDQRDDGEGGRLPEDGARHLAGREADRLQDGEVTTASAHRGDQGTTDGGDSEDDDQPGEQSREAVHALRVEHVLGGQLGAHVSAELPPEGGEGGLDRRCAANCGRPSG